MEPQPADQPQQPQPAPHPIPVARPAGSAPTQPAAQPGPWWAPRPITPLQALGDILIVAVVLVVPQAGSYLVGSSMRAAPGAVPPYTILAANSMIWATVAALAIYLTWRSGQPLSSIGFRAVNPIAALASAVMAVIVIYAALLATAIVVAILTHASRQTMTAPAREIYGMFGPPTWPMILWLSGTAGLFEEIVFRGFVLTRLRVVAGNWFWAIIIASLLFAVPHAWEGRWAVILVLPVAIVLSITFVLRRSVLAPILAHFLFNFLQLAALKTLLENPDWQHLLQPGGQ